MEDFINLSTGVRIEYVEQGSRDGHPIVFLHGVTDSWHSFERVLPLLPPSFRAFALSQRGHGDSSRPLSGYRFTDLSNDVLAFLDAKQVKQSIVVGHSMGAGVAQRFAIDHPERVSALVLMGAFATFQDPALEAFITSDIMPLTDPISPSFAREWQLSTLARPIEASHLERIVAETIKVPAFVWHAAFSGFLATPDFSEELRAVSAPTLLLWGDRDTYASAAAQERLCEVLPHADFVTYRGYGHGFHWEDPAMFVADLLSFVAREALQVSG
jgi:non-heme chloroperoxidase